VAWRVSFRGHRSPQAKYALAHPESVGGMAGLLERDRQARRGLDSLLAVAGELELNEVSDFVFACGQGVVLPDWKRSLSDILVENVCERVELVYTVLELVYSRVELGCSGDEGGRAEYVEIWREGEGRRWWFV
jgi:hypothetical protein